MPDAGIPLNEEADQAAMRGSDLPQVGILPTAKAARSQVHQADAARTEKLKDARKLEAAEVKPSTWRSKKCPKCKKESHVRRKVCDCGHIFF